MSSMTVKQPDSRGRMALNTFIDSDRSYSVSRDDRGVVTLTPVAAVLSDEQLADLKADPDGFMDMMTRVDRHNAGEGETVSVDEFFDSLDAAADD